MRVVFVAGAGTDVGKTYVASALVRRLRLAGRPVGAVKPVASGVGAWDEAAFADSDTAHLLDALGEPLTAETVQACTPWRYAAALAPDMAAALEGRDLTLAELVDFHTATLNHAPRDAVVVVEGVGGVMSPVTSDALCLDWLKAIEAEVLLVAGSYLGAISHALTAHETLVHHGRPPMAVVVSETAGSTVGLEETVAAIARRSTAPVSFLRRGAG